MSQAGSQDLLWQAHHMQPLSFPPTHTHPVAPQLQETLL